MDSPLKIPLIFFAAYTFSLYASINMLSSFPPYLILKTPEEVFILKKAVPRINRFPPYGTILMKAFKTKPVPAVGPEDRTGTNRQQIHFYENRKEYIHVQGSDFLISILLENTEKIYFISN